MYAVLPSAIAVIDRLAIDSLGFSEETLIRKAGEAVAVEIARRRPTGRVLILCGGGNNGADGYALALSLAARGYTVRAVDAFAKGQRSPGGKAVLADYTRLIGAPLSLAEAEKEAADIYVDALLGAGAVGAPSEAALAVAARFGEKEGFRVAVDIPTGADAALGTLAPSYFHAHLTVMLSFAKIGLFSYPAREACGELLMADLGLSLPEIMEKIHTYTILDDEYVKNYLPKREKRSHKGSFGTASLVVGSEKYMGAALLSAMGALRCGTGLVRVYSEAPVLPVLCAALPEAVLGLRPTEKQTALFADAAALLVGSGCGATEDLLSLVIALLQEEGAPLLLDADALNVLASLPDRGVSYLRQAKRPVLLTPHPKEFSRLTGKTVAQTEANRLGEAMAYAKETGTYLLLKGAATVITDGEEIALCPIATSALAKGGSGDVLAGMCAALLAQGAEPLHALALAAYLHGKAGETLARTLSDYGVLPSELPSAAAREICRLLGEEP